MVQLLVPFLSDSAEQMVLNSFTCPGKTPDTGVEPPEWLGELGRDLQEASRAACFLAVMIFWAAVEQKTWNISPKKRHITFIFLHVLRQNPQCSGLASGGTRTISEDSVHIEAVRRAGFIVSAAPHIWAELSGPGIIYYSGVGAADLI